MKTRMYVAANVVQVAVAVVDEYSSGNEDEDEDPEQDVLFSQVIATLVPTVAKSLVEDLEALHADIVGDEAYGAEDEDKFRTLHEALVDTLGGTMADPRRWKNVEKSGSRIVFETQGAQMVGPSKK